MEPIIYGELYQALLRDVPELEERIKAEFGAEYDLDRESPGAYPIFEDIVQNYALEMLEERRDSPSLRRLFRLFELLASSHDKNVRDLLGIAILEPLVYRPDLLAYARPYMGSNTAAYAAWEEDRQKRVHKDFRR